MFIGADRVLKIFQNKRHLERTKKLKIRKTNKQQKIKLIENLFVIFFVNKKIVPIKL